MYQVWAYLIPVEYESGLHIIDVLFFHFVVYPGDYHWIPFNISVPLSSTVPIELAVLSEKVDRAGTYGDGK